MKYCIHSLIAFVFIMSSTVEAQVKKEKPKYASAETQEIVQKMIRAHGGWDAWATATSISYDNVFFNEFAQPGQNPWWVNREITEQAGSSRNEQKTLHTYDLGGPKGGFSMAYNGSEVWATPNWSIGNYPNFMAYFFYYFLNLPWLTQDDIVQLSTPESAEYNGKQVYKIKMTFTESPAIGKTSKDWYMLYINQDSYQLEAYEYAMAFGAMMDVMGLPAESEFIGPVFRHIDEYVEVDGLLFPARMHTTNLDQSQVYGHHALINYSTKEKLDNRLVRKPANAVIDTSTEKRGTN